MLLSLLQRACGCVVAEVVAVCAAPCNRFQFGWFNTFLLLYQTEGLKDLLLPLYQGEPWSLLVEVPSFMDGNSHYFVVVEENDKKV